MILAVLSMHVLGPTTGCASAATMPTEPTPAHDTWAGTERVRISGPGVMHATDSAHGLNQCTVTAVRKTLVQVAGPASTSAIAAVAALLIVIARQRRDRLLAPYRWCIAGGLRR